MLDKTDRHFRYLARLIAPSVRLYTEMVTAQGLLHGDAKRMLAFHPYETPLALQLGGSDPQLLQRLAKLGEDWGYNEINLNVGCPSERVSSGRFGACLMLTPDLVADCIAAMQSAVSIPVTIKCRIGVDQVDTYEALSHFVQCVSDHGCRVFIIHARKAWLSGLSPKENREIPPLRYDIVHQIKLDYPQLTIIINGGISHLDAIDTQLKWVDGVMIGRAAYANPYLLADIHAQYATQQTKLSRHEIVKRYIPYMEDQLSKGVRLASMTRHLLGLFQGRRGACAWRRYLSQHSHAKNQGIDLIEKALAYIEE